VSLNVAVNVNTNGDNLLSISKAGYRIRVYGYFIKATGTVNVTLKSGAAGTVHAGPMACTATDAEMIAPLGPIGPGGQMGWFDTDVGADLNVNLSAGVQVGGHIAYDYVK